MASQDLTTLAVSVAVVWGAVGAYAVRLHLRRRALEREVAAFRARVRESGGRERGAGEER